jgi:octopine/nopaline transport system permease protein
VDLDFISEHFPRLLKATKLTIELTSLSLFFGIFVGVFFAILRTSKNKVLFFVSYYYFLQYLLYLQFF